MKFSKKTNNKAADQTAPKAQAGLRLCYSQTPEDRFSHDDAHISLVSDHVSKTSNYMYIVVNT